MSEGSPEIERPLSPNETISSGLSEISLMYSNVEPGSVAHRALLHLISYETLKHETVESEGRLKNAQQDTRDATRLDHPDLAFYQHIEQDEQEYLNKKTTGTEELIKIISANCENEAYSALSKRSAAVIEELENAHKQLETPKPFAAIAVALREINEKVVLKQEETQTAD